MYSHFVYCRPGILWATWFITLRYGSIDYCTLIYFVPSGIMQLACAILLSSGMQVVLATDCIGSESCCTLLCVHADPPF